MDNTVKILASKSDPSSAYIERADGGLAPHSLALALEMGKTVYKLAQGDVYAVASSSEELADVGEVIGYLNEEGEFTDA